MVLNAIVSGRVYRIRLPQGADPQRVLDELTGRAPATTPILGGSPWLKGEGGFRIRRKAIDAFSVGETDRA